MNPRFIDLALRKQRLQLQSAALRNDLARHVAPLAPAFGVADRVREGFRWLRRHPEAVVAGTVALLAARPRRLFRWARRGVIAWQAWRKLRGLLDAEPACHANPFR
ncbi:MAG: YqjK-like family protein [Candidatus Nitricoxidivorans perseverans]|uniref:YqjK-like family protein n=1 Tax=Candidatus Nitricoxidivorans perseverans TaxID=2975601 RepID=A0AA49FJQ7_9PROT|nr:MAG: YqjK-like family protein [Candidatus Nitricoxidivorans perseverans]